MVFDLDLNQNQIFQITIKINLNQNHLICVTSLLIMQAAQKMPPTPLIMQAVQKMVLLNYASGTKKDPLNYASGAKNKTNVNYVSDAKIK